jgi:hypothetical protein
LIFFPESLRLSMGISTSLSSVFNRMIVDQQKGLPF